MSLSEIHVLDTNGVAYETARPQLVLGDPLALMVPVRTLDRAVYVVSWRVVSAVDGHATAGSFAFGVQTVPTGAATTALTANPDTSRLELSARWLFIAGLVVLLGAAAASVGDFGGATDVRLGAAGWAAASAGLALLAVAQAQGAGVAFPELLKTNLGRALAGRAAALGVGGVALAIAAALPARRRGAMEVTLLATLAVMAVHAASGHAGSARGWQMASGVLIQWVHFAAAGVWLGGLAALLLAVRGTESQDKAVAVRRFSRLTLLALLAVAFTGLQRSFRELSSWRDLFYTDYGRTLTIKLIVTAVIVSLGAANRWISIPRASITLRPLRAAGSGELALAAIALGAAAMLGTLPPPAAGFGALRQLTLSGSDFATSVRIELAISSDRPGPNQFAVRAVDYDSRRPVEARRVALRFTPLDDPGVESSWLPLERSDDDSYRASGANLAFDGRWRVTTRIERDRDSVEVPLDVEIAGPPAAVSAVRIPGRPPQYTMEVPRIGYVRVTVDPEKAGSSQLLVTCFDVVSEPRPVRDITMTLATRRGPARRVPVRRIEPTRFAADVVFEPGRNIIVVVARWEDGSRTRTALPLDIPPP